MSTKHILINKTNITSTCWLVNALLFIITFVFSTLLFSPITMAKEQPSFDCNKATTEVEKIICSDEELSKLDVEMNKWYRKAYRWTFVIGGSFDVARANEKWIIRRDNYECRPKIVNKNACLISLYKEAIQVWKNTLLAYELTRACKFTIYDKGYTTDPNAKCNFAYIDNLIKKGADLNGYWDFNDECYNGGPVYFRAMFNKRKEVFDYIVKNGADFTSSFRKACKDRGITQAFDGPERFIFIDDIMKLNPDTNLNKWTYWHHNLLAALWGKNPQQFENNIKKLVKYGADINVVVYPEYENQSLYNYEIGDNLLSIIFNYKSFNKKFPFDYERTLNMLNYLIEQGIDIAHKNNKNKNALYYLQHSPYQIDENYYIKFEKLLTPLNKEQYL